MRFAFGRSNRVAVAVVEGIVFAAALTVVLSALRMIIS